jgi:hypothetical protein
MPRSTALATLIALALSAMTLAACGKKQNANANANAADTTSAGGAVAPPPAPVALHVTDITIGKHVGTDKRVSSPTDTFGTRDTVYVAVITDGAAPNATLTAHWTYGSNGQKVSESTQTIAPSGGTNATEFHVQKPSGWPKGQYHVEVLLDGKSAGTKSFTVK